MNTPIMDEDDAQLILTRRILQQQNAITMALHWLGRGRRDLVQKALESAFPVRPKQQTQQPND